MLQVLGPYQTLTVRPQAQGAPTADGDGLAMSVFNPPSSVPSGDRPKRFLLRVDVSNVGTSCKLTLYAKDTVITSGTGKWGIPVDPSGNFGVVANNTALPVNATYFFEAEDIGDFTEIVLVQSANVGGTPVCTAKIAAWTDLSQGKG